MDLLDAEQAKKERARVISREWKRAHPEVSRAWNTRNPEKWREYKKRFREKHPHYFDKYYHRKKRLRGEIVGSLGGKCHVCETEGIRLELHHLAYAEDSVPAFHGSWFKRAEEAKAHPERFVLLCHSDHLTLERIKRDPSALNRLLDVYQRTEGAYIQ